VLGERDVDPATPDTDPVRRYYRRLLDLTDAHVAIDVLAGTSTGGINAALLGLVNARKRDLGHLRDMWLAAGDFGQLLRDPRDQAPPSLLQGDGRMLVELKKGIDKIGGAPVDRSTDPPKTDVYITTTLLSAETRAISDDYGTQITDTDHHALFHFDEEALAGAGIEAPLALAARSSASFPGAFEPSFVAVDDQAGDGHPNVSAYVDAMRSHWAADGGLLVNRPIAPVLQAIFDREADRQVRRALLYIVPSSALPADGPVDGKATPLGLSSALLRDLGAVFNQSIAADLAAIKEHNDRTRAVADARLRLASLGSRLPRGARLADAAAWQDHRERQGEWLIAPLIAELSCQLSGSKLFSTATDQDVVLRATARAEATKSWPSSSPTEPADALKDAVSLGRSAFDAAKATLLHVLRLGYVLSTTVDQRNDLAKCGMSVLRALSDSRQTDLRNLVKQHLANAGRQQQLADLVRDLTNTYAQAQGTGEQLAAAWRQISDCATEAIPRLEELVTEWTTKHGSANRPAADATGRTSVHQRRALAAEELSCYLGFLRRGHVTAQLLDLHVAVRSVLPVRVEVQQPVELIQVSADTRTELAPHRATAATKLTGLQAHHFGAFYKRSWRANDWMWGRLDGCGWLVHVLLAPRRILTVMENDGVALGSRAVTFARKLYEALGVPVPNEFPSEDIADLAFLDDESQPLPVSLPRLATWAAAVLQRHVVAEELPVVAEQLRSGVDGKPLPAAATWLSAFDAAAKVRQPDELAKHLDSCPVATETLDDEAKRRTPLYLRTATHALAVATSAATGMKQPPQPLRPAFATARTITRTAYFAAKSTDGHRGKLTLAGLALLAVSALALLTDISVLGVAGIIGFGSGALLLAVSVGRKTVGVVQVLLALAVLLIAATPWLPWLHHHVFSWLTDTGVAMIDKHKWAWPVLLFVLLLPPVTALTDLARRRRHAPSTQTDLPARPRDRARRSLRRSASPVPGLRP
jgi:patatin-related protein